MDLKELIGPDNFKKVLSHQWAFALLACLACVDCYLVVGYQTNLASIVLVWGKDHADLGGMALLTVSLPVTIGLLIPGASHVLGPLLGLLESKLGLRTDGEAEVPYKRDWVRAERLRVWAVQNDNSTAYRVYEAFEEEREGLRFVTRMCRSIFTLSIIGWLFAVHDHPALFQSIWQRLDALPWYEAKPAELLYGGLAFAIFGFAFRSSSIYDEYVRLPGHGIPDPDAPGRPDPVSVMEQHLPLGR